MDDALLLVKVTSGGGHSSGLWSEWGQPELNPTRLSLYRTVWSQVNNLQAAILAHLKPKLSYLFNP